MRTSVHVQEKILLVTMILIFMFPVSALAVSQGDFWIRTTLETLIDRDGHLDLDDIWIRSENGVVKIAGVVRTNEEKGLATELAMEVPGVKKIDNLLTVQPANDADAKLEKKVREVLEGNSLLHIRELSVRARNGKVTIRGIVRHFSEKRLSSELLFDFPEIKRLLNKIEVLT